MKKTALVLLLALLAGAVLPGCHVLSYIGYVLAPEGPEKQQPAEFAGLAEHSLTIVIAADPSMQFEYPLARWEMAACLGSELEKNVKNLRVTDPRRVIRYQDENFDWDTLDKTKLGKLFGTDFVLYVSLAKFSMREPGSEYLYRGEIVADVAMYDMSLPEQKAKVWSLSDLRVMYPDQALPGENDIVIRAGAEMKFCDFLAKKFYKHKVPQ